MRRFNSIAFAVLMICLVLLFGQTVLPQIVNVFSRTAETIGGQMMKA
jgi:hypothetical protein